MTPTSRRRHRHFIAAPLIVAGLIVAWGTAGEEPLGGGVSVAAELTVVQTYGGSVQGDIASFHEDTVRLAATGSVLIRAEGAVHVRAGWAHFTVAGGIAQIERATDGVTVTAVSAPVLVTLGDQVLAVPAGTEWQWDGQPLPTLDDGLRVWWSARRPTDLASTRETEAIALAGASLPGPLPLIQPVAKVTPWQASLTLSAARARLDEREAGGVLLQLEEALLLDDAARAARALASAEEMGAFNSALGRARLPDLLDQSAMPAVTLSLANELASTADQWFFLSLLPAAPSLGVLPMPPADASLDLRLQQALLLPLSDNRPQGLSPLVIRQWNDSLWPLSTDTDQPELFREIVGEELSVVIAEAKTNDWVERAERYAKALPDNPAGE